LDKAESLLEDIQRLKDKDESVKMKTLSYITSCEARLREIYGDYSSVIQGWINLLDPQTKVYKPPVRRQLVRAYLKKSNGWDKIEPKIIKQILDRMEENIEEEPKEGKNIFLWFQAARYSQFVNIDNAIEKIARWHSNSESTDSVFYLYILYTLKAIRGSSDAKIKAEKLIRDSSNNTRFQGNRTTPFEWYGKGRDLKKIVNIDSLGERDDKTYSWEKTEELLENLKGRISKIKHSGKGEIELECGLKAFFTPAHGNKGKGYSDELNKNVQFYLAFSYDGLRAYNVCDLN